MPPAVVSYFTADRAHISPTAAGTTTSGAVFTTTASYCVPFCTNITCSCGAPGCEPRGDFGGAPDGFFFVSAECDP